MQEAKARFSELIERAQSDGPQVITRHGAERAVVLSIEDYRSLAETKSNKVDFISYLLSAPKIEGFEVERDRDTGREIELQPCR